MCNGFLEECTTLLSCQLHMKLFPTLAKTVSQFCMVIFYLFLALGLPSQSELLDAAIDWGSLWSWNSSGYSLSTLLPEHRRGWSWWETVRDG